MTVPPEVLDAIRDHVADDAASVVALRRSLHAHPELGWTEFVTTARIREELAALGIDDLVWGRSLYGDASRLGVPDADVVAVAREAATAAGVSGDDLAVMDGGYTGVVATIDSGRPGPRVTLRADVDALPIDESDAPTHRPAREGFRSGRQHLMHACGHDGHAATLVGVARVLRRIGVPAAGSVRFVFQPAEEGTRGAEPLVHAGWLDDTDYFFGLHNSANYGLTTGHVSGGVHEMLATTKLDVHFTGREAHFAMAPHLGRSALSAAAAVSLLSHALPRPPGSRTSVNVGRLDAGTARNVVPGSATLLAEIRSGDNAEAEEMSTAFHRLVSGIGDAFDVGTAIATVGRSPAADSDPDLVELVRAVGAQLPGVTMHGSVPFQASDDAAAMMRHVQQRGGRATYLHVGSPYAGTTHTPEFDIDEDSLVVGVAVLSAVVAELTRAGGGRPIDTPRSPA